MLEEKGKREGNRYGTIVATLVGFLALCISAYTAYMQRQQVRAAVWPILEFDSSNAPDIRFGLSNKGVGPAIIKHVIVRVDDQPMKNWALAFDKLLGPGEHHAAESDMSNRVLAAGESMIVLQPFGPDGKPISYNRDNPLFEKVNKDRFRVTVEICYRSTLGEFWTLNAGGSGPSTTTETGHCPGPSAESFQQ